MSKKESHRNVDRRFDIFLDSHEGNKEKIDQFFPVTKKRLSIISFSFLTSIIFGVARRRRIAVGVLVFLVLGCSLFFYKSGYVDLQRVLLYLERYPTIAPLIFVGIYAVLVAVLIPTLPLNLAAGFIWGACLGTVWAVLGATLGSIIAFAASRYAFREKAEVLLQKTIWKWLDDEVRKNGWRVVAFARINPVFPFGLVNWFFGISSISFQSYAWATAAFIAPPAFFISSIGFSIGNLARTSEAETLLRDFVLASAAFTILVMGRLIISRILTRNRDSDSQE